MLKASEATAAIVAENWKRVQQEVLESTASADRDAGDVEIIGVSKYVDAELTAQLVAAGCVVLGENRPQVLWEKAEHFQREGIRAAWHMIGHLQRNKVRRTLPLIAQIHSLDNLRLAETLHREAVSLEQSVSALVEVNVTDDASKTGLPRNELDKLFDSLADFGTINVVGLMAMSTHGATPQKAREEFANVRQLRDSLVARYPDLKLETLSMGMSADFSEAIAEGATQVRIGSSLWKGIL